MYRPSKFKWKIMVLINDKLFLNLEFFTCDNRLYKASK